MSVALDLRTVGALMRRALNEVLRVPAAGIPGILAPTIFALGLTAVFGSLTDLQGFGTDQYLDFFIAISFMQAAAFSGAATGVNLARDIEEGWFDRMLVAPVGRGALLAGTIASASVRVMIPLAVLMTVGLATGLVSWPGLDGLLVAVAIASGFAAVVASFATTIALRLKTQAAAPLMQSGAFLASLLTTSYAPYHLLTGWLQDVARVNPATLVVEGIRQGFVGGVTWHDTWPALLALAGMGTLLYLLALRSARQIGS